LHEESFQNSRYLVCEGSVHIQNPLCPKIASGARYFVGPVQKLFLIVTGAFCLSIISIRSPFFLVLVLLCRATTMLELRQVLRYSIIRLKLTEARINNMTSNMAIAAKSIGRFVKSPVINNPLTASTT
jgi:hypothetical protein